MLVGLEICFCFFYDKMNNIYIEIHKTHSSADFFYGLHTLRRESRERINESWIRGRKLLCVLMLAISVVIFPPSLLLSSKVILFCCSFVAIQVDVIMNIYNQHFLISLFYYFGKSPMNKMSCVQSSLIT